MHVEYTASALRTSTLLDRAQLRAALERPIRVAQHHHRSAADRPRYAEQVRDAPGDQRADDRRQADDDERVRRHDPAAQLVRDEVLERGIRRSVVHDHHEPVSYTHLTLPTSDLV